MPITPPQHPSIMHPITTTTLHRKLNHLSQNNLHWHYSNFDDKNFQIHGQTFFYLFIIFSIILLITLLLLYARWYIRFRHLHSTPILPHHHAPPSTAEHGGLDPATIKAMPIILHQQETTVQRQDQMECCICLGVFEDGDKVKVLPHCCHRFHSDCVDRWLFCHSTCPLCRLLVSFRVDPNANPGLDAV